MKTKENSLLLQLHPAITKQVEHLRIPATKGKANVPQEIQIPKAMKVRKKPREKGIWLYTLRTAYSSVL